MMTCLPSSVWPSAPTSPASASTSAAVVAPRPGSSFCTPFGFPNFPLCRSAFPPWSMRVSHRVTKGGLVKNALCHLRSKRGPTSLTKPVDRILHLGWRPQKQSRDTPPIPGARSSMQRTQFRRSLRQTAPRRASQGLQRPKALRCPRLRSWRTFARFRGSSWFCKGQVGYPELITFPPPRGGKWAGWYAHYYLEL